MHTNKLEKDLSLLAKCHHFSSIKLKKLCNFPSTCSRRKYGEMRGYEINRFTYYQIFEDFVKILDGLENGRKIE